MITLRLGQKWVRSVRDVCMIVCFTKTLFSKKNKGIPSRVPLGHIQHRSESFFRLDKSKGSNQLMKNDGFLHYRFSLGLLHLAE